MTPTHSGRPLVLFCGVCATFLAGMAVHALVGGGAIPSRQHAIGSNAGSVSSGRSGPGPTKFSNGIPAGFARSKDGARAAAVAYVRTGQVLIDLPTEELDQAVRAISAVGSADEQVSIVEHQLDEVRAVLAPGTGPTRYVQAALATRVDAFAPDRARVSVWNVGILSRNGVADPQAGWYTSVFDLVWERGDWKLWSETTDPGPAPGLNSGMSPSTSQELDAALDGFTPWE
jgi:hypothetical protein